MTSMNSGERIRQKLSDGETTIGIGVSFSDPAISELVAEAGYDFTWIDGEHSPFDLPSMLQHVMTLRGTNTASFIRVRQNEINVIKPVLDLAPAGIIIPQVQSATETEAVVKSCRYPPLGERGFGPRRGLHYGAITMEEYLQRSAIDPLIVIQVEHIRAVDNIDEILAVPGIDIVCLGPNDLSGSLNKMGQFDDPEVARVIDTVCGKVRDSDLILGVSTFYTAENFTRWIDRGVQWINLNTDSANLFSASRQVLDAARRSLI